MDDNQEIFKVFQGTQFWWTSGRVSYQAVTTSQKVSSVQRRYYKLTFHRCHRDLIINSYINHVMKQGQAVMVRNQQRKLFTNGSTESWYGGKWTKCVHFEHPAHFDTLAMDPKRKQEIIDGLLKFKNGKE
ncbi:hypothetical protein PanWU01x14_159640 [Parasponia andersonii]|uniref:Uncharacterized protein n=1 Tax=Parasponia andersonii TaxID=3476 RepID=A0A2P5CEM9_PARAD|nr:hypothetical protein PanWU01x14_159640 [Parasponia andersonii]